MENQKIYNPVSWDDIPRLYAYVLADTAASYDAKDYEERMEAKDIAEREISSILLDSSFIAEYGCQKANIKSKTLADYSRAVVANNFNAVDTSNILDNASEMQTMLLNETLDRMASLNRTFERYSTYFELSEDEAIGFSIERLDKSIIESKGIEEAQREGEYIPIQNLSKDENGNYILEDEGYVYDIPQLESELNDGFINDYLNANLEETVAKLEENSRTWEQYMRHNTSMDKVEDGHKAYTMNKFPRVTEDEGRKLFMEEHSEDAHNALIGTNRETGEKFPTTKIMANQIRNFIEFCDEVGMTLESETSAVGKGLQKSKSEEFFENMKKDLDTDLEL
mgnify:CR=1 FL=1